MRMTFLRGLTVAAGLALAIGWAMAATPTPRMKYIGSLLWHEREHHQGGFSGLEVSDDGAAFTTITDRGMILHGTFRRQADGRLVGASVSSAQALRDPDGEAVIYAMADSEGLAEGPDGTAFVSFEGKHRVWAFPPDGPTYSLSDPTTFPKMQNNSGFEALAIDDKGRLYTLPERSGQLTRPFPVFRYDPQTGKWSQPFSVLRRGNFLPVGADFGPDGALYLLEREFTGIAFRSRVRRLTLQGDRVTHDETILATHALVHGNLEGISAWRDKTGAIRLTMVSDNNFNSFQRTEFVEYRVTD
ncbi:esterase-like activity of phytase family protein [Sagittula stellata]|uniref:Phytase-like domain-containing protein n=1 Tax=Sagittula stellata (strain ATCC 700073 / DSM 11524 / E-37) TaxID=388399 RepID=A3K2P0_SAGS3|nr:esterase-like activity of phytase family protein [Sagittula stellata]EBA08449.1 hypothetical protein SSE37_16593 [Sagittula stellata E-37]